MKSFKQRLEETNLDEARFSGLKPRFGKKPTMQHYEPEEPVEKHEPKDPYLKAKADRLRTALDSYKKERFPNLKEEELTEGRPSQRHPLEGHEYHKKTDAELEYIGKDAHKAAEAMKGHNEKAENKSSN